MITHITLRSQQDLTSIASIFAAVRFRTKHIERLTIDATNSESQSWVSSVPFTLPISSLDITELIFRGVNLTHLHGAFYMSFSVFKHVRLLRLEGIRYTRYTQFTRLLRTIKAPDFRLRDEHIAQPTVNPSYTDYSRKAMLHPGRLALPPHAYDIWWDMPWDMLARFLHDSTLEDPAERLSVKLRISAEWPPASIPYTTYGAILEQFMWGFNKTRSIHGPIEFELSTGPFIVNLFSECSWHVTMSPCCLVFLIRKRLCLCRIQWRRSWTYILRQRCDHPGR